MATHVLMPALSPEMKFGKLAKWLKREGDRVEAGEILAEIETEKATMEVEAIEAGVLERILTPEGSENVAVHTPIAVLAPADFAPNGWLQPASMAASKSQKKRLSPGNSRCARPCARRWPRKCVATAMSSCLARKSAITRAPSRSRRACAGIRRPAGRRCADRRTRLRRPGCRRGHGGAAAGGRIHELQFRLAGDGPYRQFGGQDALHVGRGAGTCPIVFRGPNGARSRVGAQHAQDFSAWFAHIPGLKVVAPYSAGDAKGLLKAAIRDPNPVIFLEHEQLYGQSFPAPREKDHLVEIGSANVLRVGGDATVVAFSHGVGLALKAAKSWPRRGEAEVVDLRTLRPLDMPTVLASVGKPAAA